MKTRTTVATALMLFAPALTLAGPNDYFMTLLPPSSEVYLYGGGNRFENDAVLVSGFPVEATWLLPGGEYSYDGESYVPADWEIGLRTEFVDSTIAGRTESGLSDTTLRVTANWRSLFEGAIDIVSLQVGGVAQAHSQDLRGDTDGFVRARTQFGPTLLKAELNAILAFVDTSEDEGSKRSTLSAGFRSQLADYWYVGSDVIARNQRHTRQQTSIDVIVMKRLKDGNSIYLVAERGISGDFEGASYVELGFELRLRPSSSR